MSRRKGLLAATAFFAATMLGGVTAGAQDKVEWNRVSIQPLAQPFIAEIEAGFERTTERTDDRFVVTDSNIRETPHAAPEGLTLIRDGLADVMEWYPGYVTNTYPLLAAAELPFIVPEVRPTDLKVSAVRANRCEMGDMINNINGVAQFMSVTDAYQAMQRNAVQGFPGSAASIMAYKLFEAMKSGVMTAGQYASPNMLREAPGPREQKGHGHESSFDV